MRTQVRVERFFNDNAHSRTEIIAIGFDGLDLSVRANRARYLLECRTIVIPAKRDH